MVLWRRQWLGRVHCIDRGEIYAWTDRFDSRLILSYFLNYFIICVIKGIKNGCSCIVEIRSTYPDSKVHGANMGPTWVLSVLDEPHVGPMNLAIRVGLCLDYVPAPVYGPCRIFDQNTTLRAVDLHNARATILNPFINMFNSWYNVQHAVWTNYLFGIDDRAKFWYLVRLILVIWQYSHIVRSRGSYGWL